MRVVDEHGKQVNLNAAGFGDVPRTGDVIVNGARRYRVALCEHHAFSELAATDMLVRVETLNTEEKPK